MVFLTCFCTETCIELQARVAHDVTSTTSEAFAGIMECPEMDSYQQIGTYATILNDKVKMFSRNFKIKLSYLLI